MKVVDIKSTLHTVDTNSTPYPNTIPVSDLYGKVDLWITPYNQPLSFFLSNDNSDISGYYYCYDIDKGCDTVILNSGTLQRGNNQLLWSFITEQNKPNLKLLCSGIYNSSIFCKKSGRKTVKLYWKLSVMDINKNITNILVSPKYIIANKLHQINMQISLPNDVIINKTDRLIYEIYANVSGNGTNPTVSFYLNGNYDSRFTINSNITALLNIFSKKVNYEYQNNNFYAVASSYYLVDTSNNQVTAILPSNPYNFDTVGFLDLKGTFATNNLVLSGNGNTIMGSADNYIVDTNNESIELIFYGGDWRIK